MIGPKQALATIRVSCCATVQMSSANRSDQSALAKCLSTRGSTLSCHWAGTRLQSCCRARQRRRVSYKIISVGTGWKHIFLPIDSSSLANYHTIFLLLTTADPNSILVRHKKFLKQLERQKNAERAEVYNHVFWKKRRKKHS